MATSSLLAQPISGTVESSDPSEISSIVVAKSVDKALSKSDSSPAIHSPLKRALTPVKSLPPARTPNSSKMSKSKCQKKTQQRENADEESPVKKKARLSWPSSPLIKSPKKKSANKLQLSPLKSNGSNSAQSLNSSLGAKTKQQKTILS